MTPVNLTKKRCMRKQTLRPFFHFFFYIPIFMIGKEIGAASATTAAPVPTPMQFTAVFLKSVRYTSCGQFMQFIGPRMPPATPTRGYDVSK